MYSNLIYIEKEVETRLYFASAINQLPRSEMSRESYGTVGGQLQVALLKGVFELHLGRWGKLCDRGHAVRVSVGLSI